MANEVDIFAKKLDKLLDDWPQTKQKLVERNGDIMYQKVLANVDAVGEKTGNLKRGVTKHIGSGGGYAAIRPDYKVAPHTHLLENGHKTRNGGWVPGKHMYRNALSDLADEMQYESQKVYDDLIKSVF